MYPTIPIGSGLSLLLTRTAGSNISTGNLLTVDSNGEVVPAVSTGSLGRWEVAGVAASSAISGNPVSVFTVRGLATPMRFAVAPGAALNGSRVFLSMVDGEATLTPPTMSNNAVLLVGLLIGANGVTTTPEVVFHPQLLSQIP